jgi:hypothetical protein
MAVRGAAPCRAAWFGRDAALRRPRPYSGRNNHSPICEDAFQCFNSILAGTDPLMTRLRRSPRFATG